MEIFKFGELISGKLEAIKTRFKKSDIEGKYGFKFPETCRSLNTDTSFYKIARMEKGLEDRQINIAASKGAYLAELVEDGKVTQYAYFNPTDFDLKACEVKEEGGLLPYDVTKHSGTIIRAVLMEGAMSLHNKPYITCKNQLDDLANYDPNADEFDDGILVEDLSTALSGVTNYLYYLIKGKKSTTDVEIDKCRYAQITAFKMASVVCGYPSFVKVAEETVTPSATKVVKGEFALNPGRKFTKVEESMIPIMPDSFVCPPEAKSIPQYVKMSNAFAEPYRNILLVGDSGGGKTTLARAMASEWGLPHVIYSCGPDTDSFDTMGGIQPTTDKVKPEELHKKFDIPTFDDVANDFVNTFKKLFGKEPSKFNGPEECYEEIQRRIMEASECCEDFTYVPSNIVLAAINGWVCEIQEATIIKRESELVVLNALLENVPGTPITLPNGKVIRRHPDNIFIFTSNMNYKGCKSLQESVLSRINLRKEIRTPDEDVLAERAMAQCKTDKALGMPTLPKNVVLKMAKITKEIDAYCKDHDITDGVCGPRELNDWCKKSIMTAKLWEESSVTDEIAVKSCWSSFIEKVSQIPEEVEEVVTAVMGKYFSAELLEEARSLYENGEV